MAYAFGTGTLGWGGAAASSSTIATDAGGHITVAQHDAIFVFISVPGTHTFSVADSRGNSYALVGSVTPSLPSGNSVAVFLCRDSVSAGDCAVTVTIDSAAINRNMVFGSASGLSTSAAISSNAANGDNGNGVDHCDSGSATPSGQPALVLGFHVNPNNNAASLGTGFSAVPAGSAGTPGLFFGSDYIHVEHKRVTSTAAVHATFTLTTNDPAHGNVTAVLVIPESGAVGGGSPKGFRKWMLEAFMNAAGTIAAAPAPAPAPSGNFGPVFTTPVPTPFNTGTFARTHISQPGSRIFYVDPVAGTVTTNTATTIAQAMFWNGTNLVDASGSTTGAGAVVYGTDPLNPSGPVNTIRTLSSCLPRSDGSDVGSTSGFVGTHATDRSLVTRGGFADWILGKRGATFDMLADITAWNTSSGGAQILRGLNIARGKSTTERSVFSCYGSTAVQPPIYKKPPEAGDGMFMGDFVGGLNFALYSGYILDGQDRSASASGRTHPGRFLASNQPDRDVHFEDFWLYRCAAEFVMGNGANIYTPGGTGDSGFAGFFWFEGGKVTDTWQAGTRCQGFYFGGKHGVSGFSFHSVWGIRCGHNVDPTLQATFNPDGVAWSYGAFAVLSRNFYLSGGVDTTNTAFNDGGSITGASGYQFRQGGTLTGNFFYEGYANIGAASGYTSNGTNSSGTVNDNVLQRFAPIIAGATPVGHPGWGFQFGGGWYGGEFARNIFSQAQHSTDDKSGIGYGFSLESLIDNNDTPLRRPTTSNNVHDNIFDVAFSGSAAPTGIWEDDGAGTDLDYQWPAPITGNWGTIGQTLTCTPIPGYTGSPSYQWYKDEAPIAAPAETAATYVQRVGDDSGTNPGGLRCKVTGISYAGTTTPGLKTNTLTSNVISNAVTANNSRRFSSVPPTGITAAPSSDTIYSGNRTYATIAAAKAGEGWLDETRTLKTYLQSLGKTVTSSDGAQEFYTLITSQWRGTIDTNIWSGKKIDNHIRAGRNMAALT